MSDKNVYDTYGTLINFESTGVSMPKYLLHNRPLLNGSVFKFLPFGDLEKSHSSLLLL